MDCYFQIKISPIRVYFLSVSTIMAVLWRRRILSQSLSPVAMFPRESSASFFHARFPADPTFSQYLSGFIGNRAVCVGGKRIPSVEKSFRPHSRPLRKSPCAKLPLPPAVKKSYRNGYRYNYNGIAVEKHSER